MFLIWQNKINAVFEEKDKYEKYLYILHVYDSTQARFFLCAVIFRVKGMVGFGGWYRRKIRKTATTQ